MAGLAPSLLGALALLGTAGEAQLTELLHRLDTGLRGFPGALLLRAMVLLSLGRNVEARDGLLALGDDPAARLLLTRCRAGSGDSPLPPEKPEEEPLDVGVSWAAAQVYSLLAREKLCPESARERSFQAALQDWALRGDGRPGPPRGSLESFQPLHSSPVGTPRTSSLPRPIEGGPSAWSRGHTLLSCGSPASLGRSLQISQSPTLAFQGDPRSPPRRSKLCEQPPVGPGFEPSPAGQGEPEETGANPAPREALESTAASRPEPEEALRTPGISEATPGTPSLSPSPWSWGHPLSPEPPQFYSFVVLHALEDEVEALRVKERLEALGVPGGATFCEDFEVPGRGVLRCLQDALDRAAYTLLLLTPRFCCALGLHQLNQALLCSLTRPGWADSVVPFLPRDGSPSHLGPAAARLLAGTVWLDERSPVFERRVSRTFRPQRLRARRELWEREQRAMALRRPPETLQDLSGCLRDWQGQMEQLQALWGAALNLGVPPGLPHTQAFLGTPPAAPQSPGQQPLIIHHAQMVQLGLNNHMWGRGAAQDPEDKHPQAEGP